MAMSVSGFTYPPQQYGAYSANAGNFVPSSASQTPIVGPSAHASQSPATYDMSAADARAVNDTSSHGQLKTLLIALLIIAGLGVLGTGGYFAFRKTEEQKVSPPSKTAGEITSSASLQPGASGSGKKATTEHDRQAIPTVKPVHSPTPVLKPGEATPPSNAEVLARQVRQNAQTASMNAEIGESKLKKMDSAAMLALTEDENTHSKDLNTIFLAAFYNDAVQKHLKYPILINLASHPNLGPQDMHNIMINYNSIVSGKNLSPAEGADILEALKLNPDYSFIAWSFDPGDKKIDAAIQKGRAASGHSNFVGRVK
jgi:hypothetical protein